MDDAAASRGWCRIWTWPTAIIPDLYLPFVSLPPVIFHLVVLFTGGSSCHEGKWLYSSLLYSSANAACTKWHFNRFGDVWIRDSPPFLLGSVYHQLGLLLPAVVIWLWFRIRLHPWTSPKSAHKPTSRPCVSAWQQLSVFLHCSLYLRAESPAYSVFTNSYSV